MYEEVWRIKSDLSAIASKSIELHYGETNESSTHIKECFRRTASHWCWQPMKIHGSWNLAHNGKWEENLIPYGICIYNTHWQRITFFHQKDIRETSRNILMQCNAIWLLSLETMKLHTKSVLTMLHLKVCSLLGSKYFALGKYDVRLILIIPIRFVITISIYPRWKNT